MSLNKVNSLKSIFFFKLNQQKLFIPANIRQYGKRPDNPIKFSTSDAIYGIRSPNHNIQDDNTPWYQGLVGSISILVFLGYFCILREENDIDIDLNRSLYDRIDGLEETSLKVARQYYLDSGNKKEVQKIDQRLKELAIVI